jgi:hypothetical protein
MKGTKVDALNLKHYPRAVLASKVKKNLVMRFILVTNWVFGVYVVSLTLYWRLVHETVCSKNHIKAKIKRL